MAKALDKDPTIVAALDRLRSRLGHEAFLVADHWGPDLCAVGIASPRDPAVLAYISACVEPAECFDYELELPPTSGDDMPYQVAGRGSGVTFEELAAIVGAHLKQAEQVAAPGRDGE